MGCNSPLGGQGIRRGNRVLYRERYRAYVVRKAGKAAVERMALSPYFIVMVTCIWVPFKNCIEQRPRITTFFATSNIGKRPLLSSESSNSRYIIYNVKGIDWSYKNDIDPAELWAFAIAKAHDPKYVAELNIDQVRELEGYNKLYSTPKSAYKRRYASSRPPPQPRQPQPLQRLRLRLGAAQCLPLR